MTRRRRTERGRPAPSSAKPAAPHEPRRAAPTPAGASRGDAPWLLAVPLALAALLYACRGAPLGTAVADDYSFLARLTFQKPLDLFDSMGASFYWRPLSRQLYFTLVGPWLIEAPWGAALLHGVVLAAIGGLVYRITRRELTAPVAAAIAAGVLLSEPARVLLGWPSGAQHLLGSAFALLAVHEILSRRLATAAVAALAGLLSHESAVLALPLLPLITWRDTRDVRDTARAAAATAGVAAVWAIGYAIARHHGIAMPPSHAAGVTSSTVARMSALLARAVPAALNVEDVHGPERMTVLVGLGLAAVLACVLLTRPAARPRLHAALPVACCGLAWFVIGALPLSVLLPDWNAWRAWMPTLGLAIATPALLGAAAPWLAFTWTGLRLAGLLIAPGTPPFVTRESPPNVSHVSFTQLGRLQRIVAATRSALRSGMPQLPPHSHVCFWEMPRLAEFAYQGSHALHVWYGDSTVTWGAFGGQSGLTRTLAAGIEFRFGDSLLAAPVSGRVIDLYQRAAAFSIAGREYAADSLLQQSIVELDRSRGPFLGTLYENMALNAYRRMEYDRADSLNEYAASVGSESGSYWLLRAAHAVMMDDTPMARAAILRSLEFDPNSEAAKAVARQLGVIP